MDFFDLLSPAKKMAAAIVAKDVTKVEQILNSSFEVNSVIYTQGDQTALHVALTRQNFNEDVVKKLIEYKASPSLENGFGQTPIFKAVVHNRNPDIVKVLIQRDKSCSSMDSFWRSLESENHVLLCCQNIALILAATPFFLKYQEKIRKHCFNCIERLKDEAEPQSFNSRAYYSCLQLFLILDKSLWNTHLDNRHSVTDEGKRFISWFENVQKKAPSLQHCCRMVIRKTFDQNVNVICGVEQLSLPRTLKQFLKFCDITGFDM